MEIVFLTLVASAALFYLYRHFARAVKSSRPCTGCKACSICSSPSEKEKR